MNDAEINDELEANPADDDEPDPDPEENYVADPAMRFALERCGLNVATATYVMVDQGFDTTEELYMSSKDNFENMIKNAIKSAPPNVTFSSAAIRRLNAFKHWAEERFMCGLDTSPLLFTQPILSDYMNHLRADEIEKTARKDQTPTHARPIEA